MRAEQQGSSQSLYKHCRRYNVPGHAHALTFCCFRRQPFLNRDRTRQWTTDAIKKACSDCRFHLWAYVLMPEHVHLLIWPSASDYDVSRFLKTLKQSVAKRAICFVHAHAPSFLACMTDRQPNGRTALRFWERGGGYDRNLWEPRYIWEMIDYIHRNPVRRNLCRRPEEWLWSSAPDYYLEGYQGPLKIDRNSLPSDPRR